MQIPESIRQELRQIKEDYDRWIWVKDALEIKLKSQKQAHVRFDTRNEIDIITELLVQLDSERQWYFNRIEVIFKEFGRIAV